MTKIDQVDAEIDSFGGWRLGDQVGFLMRRAQQRHLSIFASRVPGLTSTQFAALAMLVQNGPLSQNELGRRTAMDAATIKGVVDRLRAQGLVKSDKWPDDRRRVFLTATAAGAELMTGLVRQAKQITADTLAPLTPDEQKTFLALLRRLL